LGWSETIENRLIREPFVVALVSPVLIVKAACRIDDIGDEGDSGSFQRGLVIALAGFCLFLVVGVISFAKRSAMTGQILMNATIYKFEKCSGNRQNTFDKRVIDANSILHGKQA
jgi:hypothetical protein